MFCKKRCSSNFCKINRKHQETRSLFKSSCQTWPATLVIKRLWNRCFLVNFGKSLRTAFLQNISGRLLLKSICERLLLHFWKLFGKNIFHIHCFILWNKNKRLLKQSVRLNKNVSYDKVLGEDRKYQILAKERNHSYWKKVHVKSDKKQKIFFCTPASAFQ